MNCHNEGSLLLHSVSSALAAGKALVSSGGKQTYEVLVVLDKPTPSTVESAEKLKDYDFVKIFQCEVDDLGLARNFGVSRSLGSYIAFMDGDDLWGSNWLVKALSFAQSASGSHVLHPHLNYYFGHATTRNSSLVTRHIDSLSNEFDLFTLTSSNYWTSAAFAERGVFEAVPYRAADSSLRIGFEDWSFNLECLLAGIHHSFVPETMHFIRDKPTRTMRAAHSSYGAVRYPLPFVRALSTYGTLG